MFAPGEDRNLVLGKNLILWSAAVPGSGLGEDRNNNEAYRLQLKAGAAAPRFVLGEDRNNQDFAAAAVDATAAPGARAPGEDRNGCGTTWVNRRGPSSAERSRLVRIATQCRRRIAPRRGRKHWPSALSENRNYCLDITVQVLCGSAGCPRPSEDRNRVKLGIHVVLMGSAEHPLSEDRNRFQDFELERGLYETLGMALSEDRNSRLTSSSRDGVVAALGIRA